MPRVSYPCLNVSCGRRVVTGIECSICEHWAHKTCSKLSSELFKLYSNYADLLWICQGCREIAKSALKGSQNSSDNAGDMQGQTLRVSESSLKSPPGQPTNATRKTPPNHQGKSSLLRSPLDHSTPKTHTVSPKKTRNSNQPELAIPRTKQSIQETTQGQSTVVPQNQTVVKKQNNCSIKSTAPASTHQPTQRAGQFNRNKTNPKEIGEKRGNPKPKKESRKVNRQPTGFQMGAPPDGFKAAISRLEKQEVRIENLARHIQRQLIEIQKLHASYETTLGRTRNVIIHAPEPVISNTAQRIAAEKTLILSVLRNAGCHPKMTWKRAHRLGKWVPPKQDGLPTSRPLLIASTMTNIKIGADNRTRKAVISGPHYPLDAPVVTSEKIPQQLQRTRSLDHIPKNGEPPTRITPPT
ncbi:unnamed protein product [Echinostoma caproni]|uniref:PHD domain-containing protein n=1 Tax=Echinostoma caproni TaxID=27848 RepID=A0A183A1C6_9TREM|nr:unnamed protein product [Echinostoma caproni]